MHKHLLTTFSVLLIALSFLSSCNSIVEEEIILEASNENIQYEGRIDKTNPDSVLMFWAGTSFTFRFKGTGVKATLVDEKGENYFNVILDGEPVKVLQLEKGPKEYVVAENLEDTVHTLQLFKRTEAHEGGTAFTELQLKEHPKILSPPEKPELKLLFYGNSITSGMGNEDTSRERNDSALFKNNYMAYGAMTARNLDAQYQCISLSGIGITISWFEQIMPKVYNRVNPFDSTSIYDMKNYKPDIVVVNLFQNDSWLVNQPDHEQFARRFPSGEKPSRDDIIEAYTSFAKTLIRHYPKADFIFALGNMDATREGSEWPEMLTEAVHQLRGIAPKDDLHTIFFPYKETKAHPTVEEQKAMARQLTAYIREVILD